MHLPLSKINAFDNLYLASVLSIGDELLRGAYVNKNAAEFSLRLIQAGYQVTFHISCSDQIKAINHALEFCIKNSNLVIVCGGLGPTSDDVTRQAVAQYLKKPLIEHNSEWQKITQRLNRFKIPIDESNKRQILFPLDAEIISNLNGTAAGFISKYKDKMIVSLPGPSHECLPMLDKFLSSRKIEQKKWVLNWRLMNISEAIIAARVDQISHAIRPNIQLSYLVHYPYVDIRLAADEQFVNNNDVYQTVCQNIEKEVAPFLVAREITAASQLVKKRKIFPNKIIDEITDGAIEKVLFQNKKNNSHSYFKLVIQSNGNLNPPYHGKLFVECLVEKIDKTDFYEIQISKRGSEILKAIIEFVAWCILKSFPN